MIHLLDDVRDERIGEMQIKLGAAVPFFDECHFSFVGVIDHQMASRAAWIVPDRLDQIDKKAANFPHRLWASDECRKYMKGLFVIDVLFVVVHYTLQITKGLSGNSGEFVSERPRLRDWHRPETQSQKPVAFLKQGPSAF